MVIFSAGGVLRNVPPPRYLPGGSHREGAPGGNQPLCRALHEEFRLHQGTDPPPMNLWQRLRTEQIPPHYSALYADNHPCFLSADRLLNTSIYFGCTNARVPPEGTVWWNTLQCCAAETSRCVRAMKLNSHRVPVLHQVAQKVLKNAKLACCRLGQYRMPFAWAARYSLNSSHS